jgi:tetratricopeptide (TPR) repeat protein
LSEVLTSKSPNGGKPRPFLIQLTCLAAFNQREKYFPRWPCWRSCFAASLRFLKSDDATDPVKLFEQAQDAHAKRDFQRAIELYDAAIKLKPEFPEAELQRATALLALDRVR